MAEQLNKDVQSGVNIGEHFAEQLNHISNTKIATDATHAFLNEIRKLPCDAQDEALASAEEKNREYRETTNPRGIGFRYDLIGSVLTGVDLTYPKAATMGTDQSGRGETTLPIYDLPAGLGKNCEFLPKQSDMR